MSYTEYYTIEVTKISPDKLCLDPNNPRLSLSVAGMENLSVEKICSEKIQKEILKVIHSSEFHVDDLIRGISNDGFSTATPPIIVKKISSGQYLVLEGNRRLAAIKTILSEPADLLPRVRDSLKKIPVSLFKYRKNNNYSEQDVIDGILGTIHISGQESWGPMEIAKYNFDYYMRRLDEDYDNVDGYEYVRPLMTEIAKHFNLTVPKMRANINIYCAYKEMLSADYEIKTSHYSLIKLAINGSESQDFFAFDERHGTMSNIGMKRFYHLCLSEESVIYNPKDFNGFKYVLKNGDDDDLNWIMEEGYHPLDIKRDIEERKKGTEFADRLEAILVSVRKLKPSQYRNTKRETLAIFHLDQNVKMLKQLDPGHPKSD